MASKAQREAAIRRASALVRGGGCGFLRRQYSTCLLAGTGRGCGQCDACQRADKQP